MSATNSSTKEPYGSLRLYSEISFGVGWLVIGLGILAAVIGVVLSIIDDPRLGLDRVMLAGAGFGILLILGFTGLRLLAYSDLIFVFIDLERNTRRTASRLLDLLDEAGGVDEPSS